MQDRFIYYFIGLWIQYFELLTMHEIMILICFQLYNIIHDLEI